MRFSPTAACRPTPAAGTSTSWTSSRWAPRATAWSGSVDSARIDPTQYPDSGQIQLDWARLVPLDDANLQRTIQWTGAASVDIFLDNDSERGQRPPGPDRPGSLGGSVAFYVGGIAPGDYYVAMRTAGTTNALTYSTGFYRVLAPPTLVFTSPSEEGSSRRLRHRPAQRRVGHELDGGRGPDDGPHRARHRQRGRGQRGRPEPGQRGRAPGHEHRRRRGRPRRLLDVVHDPRAELPHRRRPLPRADLRAEPAGSPQRPRRFDRPRHLEDRRRERRERQPGHRGQPPRGRQRVREGDRGHEDARARDRPRGQPLDDRLGERGRQQPRHQQLPDRPPRVPGRDSLRLPPGQARRVRAGGGLGLRDQLELLQPLGRGHDPDARGRPRPAGMRRDHDRHRAEPGARDLRLGPAGRLRRRRGALRLRAGPGRGHRPQPGLLALADRARRRLHGVRSRGSSPAGGPCASEPRTRAAPSPRRRPPRRWW